MINIQKFTFNPFQENTFILSDSTKQCIIIDPGCYTDAEKNELFQFIKDNGLNPVKLLNTHCHLDHVFGNKYVYDKFALKPEFHKAELPVFEATPSMGQMYGLTFDKSPDPETFWEDGDVIKFGNSTLEVLFTPGHSPGEISLYSKEDRFVIAGDVLFYGSIGRTDLPGGNYETLIKSIEEKLLILGDDLIVYSGHGDETNIGFERLNNPFLNSTQNS